MTDPVTTNTANATVAPAAQNPNTTREAMDKAALARNPDTLKAAQEPVTTGANKNVARSSTLVQNPPKDEVANVEGQHPSGLPQSTIDEMNAGKKALERNRPVAEALEVARGDLKAPTDQKA